MALKTSRMLPLGTKAPGFALPDVVTRRIVKLEDFAQSPALLVAFICNHCPYVKHILDSFVAFAGDYGRRGLGIVAVSPNDPRDYPEDAPEKMAQVARDREFTFPYLFDESQGVAKAYEAICTPEFFLFDRELRLAYRGQFDGSRPRSEVPVTGADLRAAADAVLTGRTGPADQTPSAGCSIKWRAGNEPAWL
jgi:peroxiredoxin